MFFTCRLSYGMFVLRLLVTVSCMSSSGFQATKLSDSTDL